MSPDYIFQGSPNNIIYAIYYNRYYMLRGLFIVSYGGNYNGKQWFIKL